MARAAVVALLLGVGGGAGPAAAVAAEGPAPTCLEKPDVHVDLVKRLFGDWEPVSGVDSRCFDPGATPDPEPVAAVEQPLPSDPLPGFDTITGSFGGPFSQSADKTRMSPAITIGGGYVYVATDNTSAPYGPGVYMYSTGEGCPGNAAAPAGTLCKATQVSSEGPGQWRPNGIAYYRGKVYVSRTGERPLAYLHSPTYQDIPVDYEHSGLSGEIHTFDSGLRDLGVRRTVALTGLDAAWGELWGRVSNVGLELPLLVDYLAAVDPGTGALRSLTPLSITTNPRVDQDYRWIARTGSDLPDAKDVALTPELNLASTGAHTALRAAPYMPAHTDWTGRPAVDVVNRDPGCVAGGLQPWLDSPVGAYSPWGMRWLIQIDGLCPVRTDYEEFLTDRRMKSTVREYALSTFLGADSDRNPVRTWKPQDQTTDTVRDIAYQAHEPRITWSGRPTEDPWQHGKQNLTYFVSDGEFYVVARQIERWFDPANGFQNVVLTATPTDAQGKVNGSPITVATSTNWSGTLTIDEDTLPSGTYQLTMTATIGGGKKVTKTNPTFRVDHTTPNGSISDLPPVVRESVATNGTITDAHSGPRDWTLQLGSQTACDDSTPDSHTGGYGCSWDSRSFADGPYQARAQLRDLVEPAYGGPNVGHSPTQTVIVDNHPPGLSLSGVLWDRGRYRQIVYHDEAPQIHISATDPASGVASIEVQVDRTTQQRFEQACPGGACSMDRDYTLPPTQFNEGTHTVRVITTDRAGWSTEQSWSILISRIPPQASDPTDTPDDSSEPASEPAPSYPNDGSTFSGSGSTSWEAQCSSPTEPMLRTIPEYVVPFAPSELRGLVPEAPVSHPLPDSALADFLASTVSIPQLPPALFEKLGATADDAIYGAREDGQLRALVNVVKTTTGWQVDELIGCSDFIFGGFLNASAP